MHALHTYQTARLRAINPRYPASSLSPLTTQILADKYCPQQKDSSSLSSGFSQTTFSILTRMKLFLMILLNIAVVVSLVICNKLLYESGFRLPWLLVSFHFSLTSIFTFFAGILGFIQPRPLPFSAVVLTSFAQSLSLGFVNISLFLNTLTIYETFKVFTLPVMVAFEVLARDRSHTPTLYILLILLAISTGLAFLGQRPFPESRSATLAALAACCATAASQFVTDYVYTKYSVPGRTLIWHQAPITTLILATAALCLEDFSTLTPTAFSPRIVILFLCSGVLAMMANTFVYSLISFVSPTGYELIGHVKHFVILASGMIVFHEHRNRNTTWLFYVGLLLQTIFFFFFTRIRLADELKNATGELGSLPLHHNTLRSLPPSLPSKDFPNHPLSRDKDETVQL